MKNLLFFVLSICVAGVALAQDGEFHLDKEYKISKDGIIDIGSSDANVFITGSSRSNAHVKIDRQVTTKGIYSGTDEFRVEVDAQDGNLRIRERQLSTNSGMVTYHREDYKIEIEAPEGVSLVVRGDDGDYFIKNIDGEISMSIDDADVDLVNCNGSKFSFRIDDGDLRMDSGSGRIMIDADDADVAIYHAAFTSIDADMDDGDLVIETSLADDGRYYINTQDGSVNLDITAGGGEFNIDHDDGNVVLQGNFKTLTESEDHTKAVLANGKAKVRVRADDARVRLSAQ